MPVPAVDKEKAALFNELVTLDPADLEQAGRIEWRLRAKLRSQPADRELQVCIVQALLQQGKAAEALVWPNICGPAVPSWIKAAWTRSSCN